MTKQTHKPPPGPDLHIYFLDPEHWVVSFPITGDLYMVDRETVKELVRKASTWTSNQAG